jgi:surface protein
MENMFSYATSFNQPLNNWDVSNVTNMSQMFWTASSFNQPLIDWDVSNVTDMSGLFGYAISFNQPLIDWDVSHVINMVATFSSAESFNQDLSNWDFNNSVHFDPFVGTYGFVNYSGLDISNYDALLSRFVDLGLQNKRLRSGDLYYCDEISRNALINDLGWEIEFDTLSEDCEMAVPENNMASIDIYPVPTENSLFLKIPAGTELKHVEIFNTQGEKIKTSAVNLQEINVENLVSGVYFIKIYTNNETLVKKFIKL